MLAIERTAGGHAICELRRGERLAPRILARGALVRAAFVPTQAGPLAGDRDSARIVVGAGAMLVVEPVAAIARLAPAVSRPLVRNSAPGPSSAKPSCGSGGRTPSRHALSITRWPGMSAT